MSKKRFSLLTAGLISLILSCCSPSKIIYENEVGLSDEEKVDSANFYVAYNEGNFPDEVKIESFFDEDFQIVRLGLISNFLSLDDLLPEEIEDNENPSLGYFLQFLIEKINSGMKKRFLKNGFYLLTDDQLDDQSLLSQVGESYPQKEEKKLVAYPEKSAAIFVKDEAEIVNNSQWLDGFVNKHSLDAALVLHHNLEIEEVISEAGKESIYIPAIELRASLVFPFDRFLKRGKAFKKQEVFYQGECNVIEDFLTAVNREKCHMGSELPRKKNYFIQWFLRFDTELIIPKNSISKKIDHDDATFSQEIQLFKDTHYDLALEYLLIRMRDSLPFERKPKT